MACVGVVGGLRVLWGEDDCEEEECAQVYVSVWMVELSLALGSSHTHVHAHAHTHTHTHTHTA